MVFGRNVRPGSSLHGGSVTPGLVRFRKHHRPCGQPAVVGGIEFFRPLPAHAGHFKRINATPSDLPLMSAGRAMYPVPAQRWQSLGSNPPPRLPTSFSLIRVPSATKLLLLRNTNTSGACHGPPALLYAGRTREQPVQKLC